MIVELMLWIGLVFNLVTLAHDTLAAGVTVWTWVTSALCVVCVAGIVSYRNQRRYFR